MDYGGMDNEYCDDRFGAGDRWRILFSKPSKSVCIRYDLLLKMDDRFNTPMMLEFVSRYGFSKSPQLCAKRKRRVPAFQICAAAAASSWALTGMFVTLSFPFLVLTSEILTLRFFKCYLPCTYLLRRE
jgi:hypothetical protein